MQPTFIILDPATGDSETHESGDLCFALAAFPPTARVFEVSYDAKSRNMVSEDITRAVVLRGVDTGQLDRDDEITHEFHDWPETYVLGDQEYTLDGVAL